MKSNKPDIIAIGGSAGSIPILSGIMNEIPPQFEAAVIVVLHRMKNVPSEMDKILAMNRPELTIREPDDKEPIRNQCIYLAPQNYHLLIEEDRSFSLDYSEPVNLCRPSIDITFESVAHAYGDRATAVLLSGANKDGAFGIGQIIAKGGIGIVQDPLSADYKAMPQAAIAECSQVRVMAPPDIINYIKTVLEKASTTR